LTYAHVLVVYLLNILATSLLDTVGFAVFFHICDRRVAGVYITLLAALSNLTVYVHKLYAFSAVEAFGMFWTQGVLTIVVLAIALRLRKGMMELDDVSRDGWAVSEKVLH